MTLLPSAFATASLDRHPRGSDIAAILYASIAAVDPRAAVAAHLRLEAHTLSVGSARYDLSGVERLLVLSIGKAAVPMARAAVELLGSRISGGVVVPKAAISPASPRIDPLMVMPGAHPVPDERSREAAQKVVALLENAGERDLVLVLLSGGGSALITWPDDDLTLDDMRALTDALLASGATINEINALRRRCDGVKGGGLARSAYPATVAVLVLSDVVGDDLGAIASGPFVATPSEMLDAPDVVARYHLHARLPERVLRLLDRPAPAPQPEYFEKVRHTIVGSVAVAAAGAAAEARARGIHPTILTTAMRGEARDVGSMLAHRLVSSEHSAPICLIAGGETTVTIHGAGLGGRNQELALSVVELVAGHDVLVVALASDGGDGPTDAAGAVVTGETLERGRARGLEPADFLRRNDAYHYFDPLGDLLKPGPTETNVNDLIFLFAF